MYTNRLARSLLKSSQNASKYTSSSRYFSLSNSTSNKNANKKYDGDSFVVGLYSNNIPLDHVYPYPEVLDEEQLENLSVMVDSLDEFMTGVNNPDENDKNSEIDPEVWESAKELGAFGLLVPEEYDGMGMVNTEYARMSEILLRDDGGFSIAI